MQQNAASHQGLHCLPLIHLLLDSVLGKPNKPYLFKFKNKYDKQFRCPNSSDKYSNVTYIEIK